MNLPTEDHASAPGLRSALKVLADRPSIVALVLGWAVLLFILQHVITGDSSPGSLVRTIVLLPMGTYGVASAVTGAMFLLPPLILGHALLIVFITERVCILKSNAPTRSVRIGRVLLCELASLVSIVVLARLSFSYFDSHSLLVRVMTLLGLPILMTVLASGVGDNTIRAALGEKFSLPKDLGVWLCSAASVWLWVFGPDRVERAAVDAPTFAFAFALTIVIAQGLLFVTIVRRASYLSTSVKVKVSTGAEAKAA